MAGQTPADSSSRSRRTPALIEGEPAQDALFEIDGLDEDGCVWICSAAGRNDWCQNLGPQAEVAEVLRQWLASIDYDEKT